MSSYSIVTGLAKTLPTTTLLACEELSVGYDVVIKFLSAENLPKTDVISHGDPYFVAKIDDQVTFTSTIVSNTAAPKWDDEEWIVRNIPQTAKLLVVIHDKDDERLHDDYIGQFEIANLIDYHAPLDGHDIVGPFGRHHGRFHLSIQSTKSPISSQQLPRYTFDGPCRYSRHDSLAVGRLTMLNADCIYSTWKIQMRRISYFFCADKRQHWNKQHKEARYIFSGCLLSLASQNTIKLAHKVLYGRTLKHAENGRLASADDLWKWIFLDRTTQRIKPCIYTYVIDDNTWRFSETGARFFIDFASKHALLANCSKYVRYAGEFHPRPKFGWDRWDDEWELVIDNGSGTYAPSADLLANLKAMLLFNFPGLHVVTYDFRDPLLKESMEQLKAAAEMYPNSMTSINQLVLTPSTILHCPSKKSE